MAGIMDQATNTRLEVVEAWMNSNKIPTADGAGERNLAKTVLDMEIYVTALASNPPIQTSNVNAIVEDKIKKEIEGIIDIKLRTALQFVQNGNQGQGGGQAWFKSVLESKAVQEIGNVIDAKQYRQWNKKMKNALEQIRPNSRTVLDLVEKLTEDEINDANKQGIFDSKLEIINTLISNKRNGNQDMSDILRTIKTCGQS